MKTPAPTFLTAAAAAALAPAAMAGSLFTADLGTLNEGFDNNSASGTATLFLDDDNIAADGRSGTATLRVQIRADGLPDVSGIPGATHGAHIHGQFESNLGLPPGQQTSGPFFSGEGGDPVDSVTPTNADDSDNIFANDYVNFFEGLPDYGPVVLNLSAIQVPAAPDGVPPLIQGINVAQADNGIDLLDVFPNRGTEFVLDTTYAFDLSDQDQRRQYNNLTPLEQREIVLHGLVVPADINNPIDELAMELDLNPALLGVETDGGFFRTTGPVAAGSIVLVDDNAQAIPTPSAALAGTALLGGLLARRRRVG